MNLAAQAKIWKDISHDFTQLGPAIQEASSSLSKVNNAHKKIQDRIATKEGFTHKAASKLSLIYQESISKVSLEAEYLILTKSLSED
jgi:hypothetical protein